MDFKQRFQGKTSLITKDGVIENIFSSHTQMKPVSKSKNSNLTINTDQYMDKK